MAYTRITSTKNGLSAIRYACDGPSHKEGVDRVLMMSGLNVTTSDPKAQMGETWDRFGKGNGDYVQMYRLIQSFSDNELQASNEEDVIKANELGFELANELYPKHECLVVTQADGEGGKLHNHILVNAVSFVDGRSLRSRSTAWEAVANANDRVIERHGMKPIDRSLRDRRTMTEEVLNEQGEYVWKDDIKKRIHDGIYHEDVKDSQDFQDYMKDTHSVDVRFRGKGISYAFEDAEGKQRRVRAKRLGEDYGRETVLEKLEQKRMGLLEPKEAPTFKTVSQRSTVKQSVDVVDDSISIDEMLDEIQERELVQEQERQRLIAEEKEREEEERKKLQEERRLKQRKRREPTISYNKAMPPKEDVVNAVEEQVQEEEELEL